jgi:hypothetical protein
MVADNVRDFSLPLGAADFSRENIASFRIVAICESAELGL